MNQYRVTLSDGNTITTGMNATIEEAQAYYLGKTMNIGNGPHDKLASVVEVVEINARRLGVNAQEIYKAVILAMQPAEDLATSPPTVAEYCELMMRISDAANHRVVMAKFNQEQ